MATDTSPFDPSEAKRHLTALLTSCESIGNLSGSSAVTWSLSGMRQLVAETREPLPLPDCLILAGVMAHLIDDVVRGAHRVGVLPRELVDTRRALLAFMERCAWAAAMPPPAETSEPKVDRALRYLRDHYARADLTANELARHVGLSRSYLARLVLHCTGRSVLDHLHALRLGEAQRLLVVTPLSVKEIAAAVGYNDVTQFCRRFKRGYGTSPAGYRRAARSANRASRRGRRAGTA